MVSIAKCFSNLGSTLRGFIVVASSVFVYTKTILLCKILVGNTQTLELHRADAGYAVFMIRLNPTPDPQSR